MASTTKIIAIGNSAGIILPKETLARLNVGKGDTLYLSESPSGFQITPYDEEFSSKMEVADRVIRRYRDAFKKLAE
ncbi:MAG TPA: AbrB/MazE/SpoVT family DNA-binding domain-containing protein [Terracidiphilus sp.]|jgi:putative addiction module antidote|nr:AbrB/MazE/SpoVT family DNA-binding domain-containing protein [Terracidiphilus sp.]